MPGWNSFVDGWSLGPVGSGAAIELDEPLNGFRLGIFPVSNHVLLWGQAADATPDVYRLVTSGFLGNLASFLRKVGALGLARSAWVKLSAQDLRAQAQPGHIRLRFDRRPIRIGHSIIEMPKSEAPVRAVSSLAGRRLSEV